MSKPSEALAVVQDLSTEDREQLKSELAGQPVEASCAATARSDADLALKRYDSILRYLATETQIFWTRAQLFTVANTALLGLIFRDLLRPTNGADSDATIFPLLVSLVGLGLCYLWWDALKAGRIWMNHWKCLLRNLEEGAYGSMVLFRERPTNHPESSRSPEKANLFFSALWFCAVLYSLWLFFTLPSVGVNL